MKNDITAISIANHLIKEYEVNNLYLQKLLYYLQNNYMYKNDGNLLFEDKIQKWKLGPVVPDVYHAFKENGTSNIIEPYQQYDIKIDNGSLIIEEKNDELPEDIKEFINLTMVDLLKYDKFELVNRTHKHPEWAKYEKEILNGSKNLEYDYKSLYEYFKKNPKKLLVSIDE